MNIADRIINLKWTKNLGFPVPDPEVIREALNVSDPVLLSERAGKFLDLHERRERQIKLAEEQPLKFGVELEPWRDADRLLEQCSLLCVFGGNRASKSEWAAKRVTQTLLDNPKVFIMGVCQKLQTSGILMQKKIWQNLPPDIQALNHSVDRDGKYWIRYTEADGFSKNMLVLPNRSKIIFVGYSQETKDYEGLEFGCQEISCIGAWAEEDMPLGWLTLLRTRCSNLAAKVIWTFTAIDGLTKTMQDVLKGIKTVESRPAKELPQDCELLPDCPKGHAPYIVETFNPKIKCIHFFTEFNPWSNYPEVVDTCKGKPQFYWERRLYGFARTAKGRQFPKFGTVHIVKRDLVPWDVPGTNYMVVDPAGKKNWFMLWARFIRWEVPRCYIYREWPSRAEFGEWHVTSASNKHDGDRGPAQDPLGYGISEYKKTMRQREVEPIYMRIIDPRAGREQKASDFGQTCVIDQLYDIQRNSNGEIVGESLMFDPAFGLEESTGISTINDYLHYDQSLPLDPIMNYPNLFISEDCGNLIDAMETYTGLDGINAACKDPIDCLRYLLTYGFDYVDEKEKRFIKGHTY
jgi:hypothetical protein